MGKTILTAKQLDFLEFIQKEPQITKHFYFTGGTVTLASQFMKVTEIKDFPKMLIPFNQKEMERFFLQLAKSLEKDIVK